MDNILTEYGVQQAVCMYGVHFQAHYLDRNSESLPGQEEQTVLMVEELVAQMLLTMFDGVLIDEVKITDVVPKRPAEGMHMLRLNARCPHHAFPTHPEEVAMTECTLEHKL